MHDQQREGMISANWDFWDVSGGDKEQCCNMISYSLHRKCVSVIRFVGLVAHFTDTYIQVTDVARFIYATLYLVNAKS